MLVVTECTSTARGEGQFREIDMVQEMTDGQGIEVFTTRCPIRLDGTVLKNQMLAPRVGQRKGSRSSSLPPGCFQLPALTPDGTREWQCRGKAAVDWQRRRCG